MSKPVIVGSIRLEGRPFRKGDEAALLEKSTPEQRAGWLQRGLIEGDWDISGSELETLQTSRATGEVLATLTKERDDALNQLQEQQKTFDASYQHVIAESDALQAENGRLKAESDTTRKTLETSAAQISGQMGVAQSSDETPLAYVERFARDEVEGISARLGNLEPLTTQVAELQTQVTELQTQLATSQAAQTPVLRQIALLSSSVVDALEGAGLTSGVAIRATPDADLRKVSGVGDATLKQLRDLFGAYQPAE